MRIADLPWYDLPELQACTDAWWRGIAGHLRALGVDRVPEQLTREGAHDARWADGNLLLSQACGYDVLWDSADILVPIATPRYAAPGCCGPRYVSEVVVADRSPRATLADLRGARCAVNEATSHSGTNALRPLIAPLARDGRFFASVVETGAHSDSLRLLQDGEIDVACVDAVVLALLRQERPRLVTSLRTLAITAPALAPPYVTAVHTPPAVRSLLQQALLAAAADPRLAECRRRLLLDGFDLLPAEAYDELRACEVVALQHGYRELPAPRRSPLRDGVERSGARGACGH
ncbi:MAG: PhnD/SsuA/transferrin family substrate-binding protein [Planctomycetes bacterium]|nr:PhnD/SsuA/transferrin family substrate-binding protein [Planctomycetota bacterium]